MAFFDLSRTGELVNRLSADTSLVGQALTNNISDGLRALAQISVGVSMMVQLHCWAEQQPVCDYLGVLFSVLSLT